MRICFGKTAALLACAAFLAAASNARGAAIDKALDGIHGAPPFSADAFDFVVIGDNQNYEPTGQPACFKQMLREFNVLQPSFVMDVGDLILGGAAEGLPPQWKAFEQVVGQCQVPFFPVVGNHDVSDAASEQLWMREMGPTRYSFRYGNSLFIALDSEEVDALDRLPGAQVEWLKTELQAAVGVTNIFLFLHQPLFSDLDELGQPIDWRPHWDNVDEAIKGYPVKAVFAGHVHVYRDYGLRDGVHYVITGGAGVGSGGATEEEGNFNHYLLVRVRGGQVNWSVIRPGNVLPSEVVTSKRIEEMYEASTHLVACEEVDVPYGESCDRDFTVTIKNPNDRPFDSKITWETVPGWMVSPAEASYTAPAKGSVPVVFHLKADDAAHVRFPVPRLKTAFEIAQYGPAINVAKDLPLTPTAGVHHAPAGIRIDADFQEWPDTSWIPLIYPSEGFDAASKDDLSSRMALMWDEQYLYFATEAIDDEQVQPFAGDTVWAADNIEFFINAWHWGFTLTKHGPEVFLYEGVDVSVETVNTEVKLAVRRDGHRTLYEAAIPARFMKPSMLGPGCVCQVCMIMNDLDTHGERHWLELMPGAGIDNARARKIRMTLSAH